MHHNLDLTSIITPVKVKVLEDLLLESQYDKNEIDFLIDGFTNGFDISYEGPVHRRDTASNLPFQVGVGDKYDLWNKIMKEVEERRYAGPYDQIPFDSCIQSPIGLVPKVGGKTRLIFHLSYDFKKSSYFSVNHYTPKEKCSVHYYGLDDAVVNSFKWRNQSGKVFYSKTDLKSAFRILPLKVSCYRWLILKAINPVTGKLSYFVEKNLPFGHSISCSHFQCFSNALRHILEYRMQMTLFATNYLDDYLFVQKTLEDCNNLVRNFLQLCETIGVTVAEDKTEFVTQVIVFLGILLDGENFVLALPEEKCNKAINWIQSMLVKKKTTVKELEKLVGFLNFLGRAIVPGRAFTRRMNSKFTKQTECLKQYHHINLDREFKDDCKMWKIFLTC